MEFPRFLARFWDLSSTLIFPKQLALRPEGLLMKNGMTLFETEYNREEKRRLEYRSGERGGE